MSRQYPSARPRRMRANAFSRAIMRENHLQPSDMIYPLFIIDGENQKQAIPSMPGIERLTVDLLIEEAQTVYQLGIPAIALFPCIDASLKTPLAEMAYDDDGLLQRAIRRLKQEVPHLGIIADVALDPYTSHGQDGIIDGNNHILNDETVAILVKQAVSLARAGCDIIAPSDMMDGRIKGIRNALEANQFVNTKILAYSAKYASAFYNPFREAVDSLAALGKADKKTYQLDPANANEAMQEVLLDIEEGADMVMVKPGMLYLDIVYRVKERFGMPTLAYQVSGEYAMLHAAFQNGWLEEKACVMESLLAFKRAGADCILTYFAKTVAQWYQDKAA